MTQPPAPTAPGRPGPPRPRQSCPYSVRLGVHALGLPDEPAGADTAAEFERHLSSCLLCQDEYDRLAVLPGLLVTVRGSGVDLAGRAGSEPPPEVLDRVLATLRSERRRRRHRLVVAASAVVLLGASGAVAVAVWPSPAGPPSARQTGAPPTPRPTTRPPEPWPTVTPDHAETFPAGESHFGVDADTAVAAWPWGSRVAMTLRGLTPGTSCRLVVRARDGRTESVGSWRVSYRDALRVEGMTAFGFDELAELEVLDGADRRLVVVPVRTQEKRPR